MKTKGLLDSIREYLEELKAVHGSLREFSRLAGVPAYSLSRILTADPNYQPRPETLVKIISAMAKRDGRRGIDELSHGEITARIARLNMDDLEIVYKLIETLVNKDCVEKNVLTMLISCIDMAHKQCLSANKKAPTN